MRYQQGIWLPDKDTASFWSDEYEKRDYNKLNLSGDVCLDIGAHVGIWTKRLSMDFSQVICFEPLSMHRECHEENCKGLNNITLHEYALSDIETKAIMTTKDKNSGMSSLEKKRFRNKKEVFVKTKTLDSFNFDKIDFMKIDVEGHGYKVLKGGIETILRCKPRIFIEMWGSEFDKTSQLLEEFGYTVNKISRQNYICEAL